MYILIVEDDPRITDFLQRGLRAEGHQVECAATGDAGLRAARHRAAIAPTSPGPSVIILDVMLPGLSGLEVCQTLRAEQVSIPILMLTAMGSLEDRIAGLRMGADDYLCKPFEFEELLARLEALGRRTQPLRLPATTTLEVLDLRLDRISMRVSRAGLPIPLTARELALLELFMSAPGRLLSRERILANIWGYNADPLTNIVDVYVRRLRTKVDEGFSVPLIHTVRGLGYRLEAPPASLA